MEELNILVKKIENKLSELKSQLIELQKQDIESFKKVVVQMYNISYLDSNDIRFLKTRNEEIANILNWFYLLLKNSIIDHPDHPSLFTVSRYALLEHINSILIDICENENLNIEELNETIPTYETEILKDNEWMCRPYWDSPVGICSSSSNESEEIEELECDSCDYKEKVKKYKPKTYFELIKLVDDKTIKLGDIDISLIDNMSALFFDSNRENFDGIETWDVNHVKHMDSMFKNSKLNVDISHWNINNVETMDNMFDNCYLLPERFKPKKK